MSHFSASTIDCPHKGVPCFRKIGVDQCELLTWVDPKWGHGRSFCSFWKLEDEVDVRALKPEDRDAEIYRLHEEQGISIDTISSMFQISREYIRLILTNQRKAHGIPTRHYDPAITEQKQARARELLKQGLGLSEIATAVRRSPTTITRWKQEGII